MNNNISLLAVVAALVVLGSPSSSHAQYRPTGDDGITASPKARQFLDERKRAGSAYSTAAQVAADHSVGYRAVNGDGVAASPKMRESLNRRAAAAAESPQVAAKGVGYRPTGDDGVTASPRMREALNASGEATFQIAPVK